MSPLIQRAVHLIGASLYFACLLLTYQHFVYEKFAYQGFDLDFEQRKLLLSLAVLFILVLLTNSNSTKPSEFFSLIYLYLTIIPTLIFFIFNEYSPLFLCTVVLSFLFPLVWCRYFILKIPIFRNGRNFAFSLSAFLIFVFLANLSLKLKELTFNFDLNLIYDFREENKDAAGLGILAYFNNWVLFIIGPMFIGWVYTKKSRIGLLAVFLFYILCFGVTQDTIVLFIPVVIIGAMYILGKRQWLMVFLPIALSALLATSFLIFYFYDSLFPATWFPRRVFFVPVQISEAYFSYFQSNPFVYWSQSNFTLNLIDTIYSNSDRVSVIIGQFMGLNSNANTGFLSAGFMHFGYLGAAFYTFCVGLLMSLLDGICRSKIDVAAVFLPMFMIFFSSDLPTVFLTKGLLLALLIIMLLRTSSFRRESAL
jgi:hypothetical protein